MAFPPPSPPLAKKPKMSSSSDPEPEIEPAAAAAHGGGGEPRRRYKRRKVAIFIAYCGFGYQGMQKNPGAHTIEGDLEAALFLSGAVPESDKCNPKRYDWARSARTDKGVSAAGQVVSGRFYVDPPGFVERMNSNLSDQIRALGYKRVTNSFNAKKFCDRRRYVYLLPVFALDPDSHRDRESVMASVGSENELAKCEECSERGRKVVGLIGRQSMVSREEEKGEIEDDNGGAEGKTELCGEEMKVEEPAVGKEKENNDLEAPNMSIEARVKAPDSESEACHSVVLQEGEPCKLTVEENFANGDTGVSVEEVSNNGSKGDEIIAQGLSKFEYGEKEKERLNGILRRYVGTHNFHNFTTRTKAGDPSAQRYIISFNADSVVNIEGIEFVRCEVVGQSFMLHQIRKMIGLAVAMMRDCCPESLMNVALRKDININVPTAPEVGLYLDECLFSSYNQKWKDTHEPVTTDAYADQVEEFRLKNIYPHIAAMEHKEGAVAVWLHSLNHRNYPDFHFQETNGRSEHASAGHPQVDKTKNFSANAAHLLVNERYGLSAEEHPQPKVDEMED